MSMADVSRNLRQYEERVTDALLEIADKNAMEAANSAKQNRRWNDVTSQARDGLEGSAEKVDGGVRFVVCHTARHGLYLELANGRKNAIIEESLLPAAMNAFKEARELLS